MRTIEANTFLQEISDEYMCKLAKMVNAGMVNTLFNPTKEQLSIFIDIDDRYICIKSIAWRENGEIHQEMTDVIEYDNITEWSLWMYLTCVKNWDKSTVN